MGGIFMKLGELEFKVFLIITIMVIDIIVGAIDHIYYLKDSNSGGGIKSLFTKLGIASFLIGILFILHLNDFGDFSNDINPILDICRSGSDVIIIMLLFYELTSLLAHLQNITGLDFSFLTPVKSELTKKKLNKFEYDAKVKVMKEENKQDEREN